MMFYVGLMLGKTVLHLKQTISMFKVLEFFNPEISFNVLSLIKI